MNKKLFRFFIPAVLITFCFTILASAQVPYYQQYQQYPYQQAYGYQAKRPVYDRIQNQRARVADGIRDGSLTRQEAERLQRRMNDLQRELDSNSRNGNVSAGAYNHIQAELDDISHNIYQAKHNYDNSYNNNNGYYNNNSGYNNNGYYNNGSYNNNNGYNNSPYYRDNGNNTGRRHRNRDNRNVQVSPDYNNGAPLVIGTGVPTRR